MTVTTELQRLLPIVKNAEGPLDDEIMIQIWCNLKSIDRSAITDQDGILIAWHGKDDNPKWLSPRFDSNRQAIDDLVRELGYLRDSASPGFKGEKHAEAGVWRPPIKGPFEVSLHPTSECLAILAALMKAKIAEGEG